MLEAWWIGAMAVFLVALLVAERRESSVGKWGTKPVASACFIGLAATAPGDDPYKMWVLVALGLSWLGDVLLIPSDKRAFLVGIVAFLLAHVAYIGAFLTLGLDRVVTMAAGVAAAVFAVFVSRWLLPHAGRLKGAVGAYIVVISIMVAVAAGATAAGATWLIGVGAVLFFASDLSVARNRFVAPDWINRLWGLPLYYGAQVLLAVSVQV